MLDAPAPRRASCACGQQFILISRRASGSRSSAPRPSVHGRQPRRGHGRQHPGRDSAAETDNDCDPHAARPSADPVDLDRPPRSQSLPLGDSDSPPSRAPRRERRPSGNLRGVYLPLSRFLLRAPLLPWRRCGAGARALRAPARARAIALASPTLRGARPGRARDRASSGTRGGRRFGDAAAGSWRGSAWGARHDDDDRDRARRRPHLAPSWAGVDALARALLDDAAVRDARGCALAPSAVARRQRVRWIGPGEPFGEVREAELDARLGARSCGDRATGRPGRRCARPRRAVDDARPDDARRAAARAGRRRPPAERSRAAARRAAAGRLPRGAAGGAGRAPSARSTTPRRSRRRSRRDGAPGRRSQPSRARRQAVLVHRPRAPRLARAAVERAAGWCRCWSGCRRRWRRRPPSASPAGARRRARRAHRDLRGGRVRLAALAAGDYGVDARRTTTTPTPAAASRRRRRFWRSARRRGHRGRARRQPRGDARPAALAAALADARRAAACHPRPSCSSPRRRGRAARRRGPGGCSASTRPPAPRWAASPTRWARRCARRSTSSRRRAARPPRRGDGSTSPSPPPRRSPIWPRTRRCARANAGPLALERTRRRSGARATSSSWPTPPQPERARAARRAGPARVDRPLAARARPLGDRPRRRRRACSSAGACSASTRPGRCRSGRSPSWRSSRGCRSTASWSRRRAGGCRPRAEPRARPRSRRWRARRRRPALRAGRRRRRAAARRSRGAGRRRRSRGTRAGVRDLAAARRGRRRDGRRVEAVVMLVEEPDDDATPPARAGGRGSCRGDPPRRRAAPPLAGWRTFKLFGAAGPPGRAAAARSSPTVARRAARGRDRPLVLPALRRRARAAAAPAPARPRAGRRRLDRSSAACARRSRRPAPRAALSGARDRRLSPGARPLRAPTSSSRSTPSSKPTASSAARCSARDAETTRPDRAACARCRRARAGAWASISRPATRWRAERRRAAEARTALDDEDRAGRRCRLPRGGPRPARRARPSAPSGPFADHRARVAEAAPRAACPRAPRAALPDAAPPRRRCACSGPIPTASAWPTPSGSGRSRGSHGPRDDGGRRLAPARAAGRPALRPRDRRIRRRRR